MGRVWFYVKLDPDAVSLSRIRNPAAALQICCPNVIQYCALLSSAGLGIRIRIFGSDPGGLCRKLLNDLTGKSTGSGNF